MPCPMRFLLCSRKCYFISSRLLRGRLREPVVCISNLFSGLCERWVVLSIKPAVLQNIMTWQCVIQVDAAPIDRSGGGLSCVPYALIITPI